MREGRLPSGVDLSAPILCEVRRHLVGLPRNNARARSLSFFSALVWGPSLLCLKSLTPDPAPNLTRARTRPETLHRWHQ